MFCSKVVRQQAVYNLLIKSSLTLKLKTRKHVYNTFKHQQHMFGIIVLGVSKLRSFNSLMNHKLSFPYTFQWSVALSRVAALWEARTLKPMTTHGRSNCAAMAASCVEELWWTTTGSSLLLTVCKWKGLFWLAEDFMLCMIMMGPSW